MSEKIVPLALAKHKPPEPPDAPASEPRPTRLEHAEQTVTIMNFYDLEDEDIVRVMVAAERLSRAVELGIRGYGATCLDNVECEENLELLREMASGLAFVCYKAKQLIAAGPGAEPWTSPAA